PEHLGRRADDFRAGRLVLEVEEAHTLPCVRLDDDLVSCSNELAHAGRDQPDPILVDLDFARDSDSHGGLREESVRSNKLSARARTETANSGSSGIDSRIILRHTATLWQIMPLGTRL